MSVADQITRIQTNIANAYSSCEAKGANLPEIQNSDNLASVIDSIENPDVNLLDVEFTHNDTYEAPNQYTGFGKVTVNVPNGDDSFEAFLVLSNVVNSGYKEESDNVINETLNILRNI